MPSVTEQAGLETPPSLSSCDISSVSYSLLSVLLGDAPGTHPSAERRLGWSQFLVIINKL